MHNAPYYSGNPSVWKKLKDSHASPSYTPCKAGARCGSCDRLRQSVVFGESRTAPHQISGYINVGQVDKAINN